MQQGWHSGGWPDDADTLIEPARPPRRPVFVRINRFAIAFVMLDVFSIVLTLAGVRGWAYGLAFSTVAIALVILDARELRRHGYQVTAWWLLLTGIAYLIHRTRRAQQSVVIPVAYALTSLAVAVIMANILTAAIAEEQRLIEEEAGRIDLIEIELRQEFAGRDAEVSCDGRMWGVYGWTETSCEIWMDDEYHWVDVTVHEDGTWTWVEGDEGTLLLNN